MRGLLDLGHRVTVEAISIPAPQPHSLDRCKALWVAGQICSYTGRYDEAQRYLYESLAIARHHGDRRMVAAVRNILALAALGQGDRAAAQVHSEEALDLARKVGNKREIAVASNALAQLHRLDGRLDRAEPLYEEVVALAHDLHDREFVAIGLLGLAMVAISRGSAERARDLLREALAIATKPTQGLRDKVSSKSQRVLRLCGRIGTALHAFTVPPRLKRCAPGFEGTLRTRRFYSRCSPRRARRLANDSHALKRRAANCRPNRRLQMFAPGYPATTNRLIHIQLISHGSSVVQKLPSSRCTVKAYS